MRWSRGQKLALTLRGVVAEESYRDAVVASRTVEGRGSFNDALEAWAKPLGIRAEDGSYLAELKAGSMSLSALLQEFDDCGRPPKEMKASLERLLAAALIMSSEGQ